MTRPRAVVIVAGVLASLGIGCFIESAQPSTFRFQCDASEDCGEGEVCADGLCQQPCGPQMEACTNGSICINNYCSSVCPLDQEVCPAPQECVALSEDDEVESGICTVLCDDDHPCGENQLCAAGLCATLCETVDDCGSAEDCVEFGPDISVCVPSGSGGGFP